jgi:hypothetical protein
MEETVSNAVEEVKNASEEDLKKVIEQHFEQVRTQGMHIGAQFLSAAVYSAIEKNLKNGKNSSLRDYQRAIKRVVEIVSIHLKTQQNDLETDEPAQEEEES